MTDETEPEPDTEADAGPGTLATVVLFLDRVALLALAAAVVVGVVSRLVDDGTRWAQVGMALVPVALLAALASLLLGARATDPARRPRSPVVDAVVVALTAASLAMSALYWETGLGTPARALAPAVAAFALTLLSPVVASRNGSARP